MGFGHQFLNQANKSSVPSVAQFKDWPLTRQTVGFLNFVILSGMMQPRRRIVDN